MAIDEDRGRFEALHAAGLALASLTDLPSILQRIVELACGVSGARYGALGVIGEDRHLVQFLNHGMTETEVAAIGHLPEGHGLLGALIDDAVPLRLERIVDDPRAAGFPPNHPPMTAFLGVPIVVKGDVFGNLYLTDRPGSEPFDEGDEKAVIALAAHAGVAIENARLRAQMERAAVIEDRERIAKDLHDDIVQSLFAEGLSLQAAMAETDDPRLSARLSTAVDNLDRVIRDLRGYIFGLHGDGAQTSLSVAITEITEAYAEGSKIAIVLELEDAVLSPTRTADVLQVVREALSNAVRHSGGSRISVSMHVDDEGTEITVHDDGVGFDPSAPGSGNGLSNLGARAESLGGRLQITSEPGAGTRLSLWLPT